MPELNIPNIDLNSELKRCKSMEDLVGKNGLMQRLFGNIIQQFLEAEMEEHLGREKYERSSEGERNYRNGYSTKKIKTSFGETPLSVLRDRKAEFEPKIVKKYETVCNELDKKVIGLYARGMSVDDI
ncbi:transposase, partial [Clostridium thermarum]|uniref:transposase n=1 Tax=Clostridium thermarum TaxID=1716543 RepID=UPI00193F008A